MSAHLTSQINALLKRCYKYGYCQEINTLEDLIESADCKLFKNLQTHRHCLHYFQLNHKIIISGLKDISTTSRTTLQNYVNVPSSHIAYHFTVSVHGVSLFYYFSGFAILTAFIDHVCLLHAFNKSCKLKFHVNGCILCIFVCCDCYHSAWLPGFINY